MGHSISVSFPLGLCVLLSSCASGGGVSREGNIHRIERVFTHSLRMRRPEGNPANPRAHHWEKDFRADSPPSAALDCRPMGELHGGLDLAAIRGCLRSIQPGTDLVYALERGNQPRLVLEEEEPGDAPACVKATRLDELAVPREIVFQSAEHREDSPAAHPSCYSSRVEGDTGLGADLGPLLRTNKVVLKLQFPFEGMPDDDESTLWLLTSWSLSPFRGEDGRISSHLMPDRLCDRCLGEPNRVKPWQQAPRTWPESDQNP